MVFGILALTWALAAVVGFAAAVVFLARPASRPTALLVVAAAFAVSVVAVLAAAGIGFLVYL